MSSDLIDYFNKSPKLGVLSTSSTDGKVNSAVFGSPQMIDEKTVIAATADNRTFANLQENPYALYTIMSQREGSVSSHIRIGDKVSGSLIPIGQADLLLGLEPAETLRNLPFLKEGGKVLVNTHGQLQDIGCSREKYQVPK